MQVIRHEHIIADEPVRSRGTPYAHEEVMYIVAIQMNARRANANGKPKDIPSPRRIHQRQVSRSGASNLITVHAFIIGGRDCIPAHLRRGGGGGSLRTRKTSLLGRNTILLSGWGS